MTLTSLTSLLLQAKPHTWAAPARYAGAALWSLSTRVRRPGPVAVNDWGEELPMITACYESHLKQCKLLEALAELRGDS